MQFTRNQIIFSAIGIGVALILAFVVVGILPGIRRTSDVTTLTMWGVDDPKVWASIIADFRKERPDLDVTYKRIEESKYERELIDAMALGKAPDIFMFENNWLLKHGEKLTPATFQLPKLDTPIVKISTTEAIPLFPKVVEQDFVTGGKVYALPLYIDTLALVYNKDLFDQGEIVFPPTSWDEVGVITNTLKIVDGDSINRAAFALGGSSSNISHAAELVSAFMLQSGTQMINSDLNTATFGSREGEKAFASYMRFSNPSSSSYTWNESMSLDKEAFIKGDLAALFLYATEAEDLAKRNSFLDIEVAPLPQVDTANIVNIADYWGLAVWANSGQQINAWDFVIFATTNEEVAGNYAGLTRRPPALRSLLNQTLNHPDFGVFSTQALTARSWLQLGEESFTESIDEAIEAVLSGELTPERAISRAGSIITDELRDR